MSNETAVSNWQRKRTRDSRLVESELAKKFEKVNAYRYNSASLRVRIIDSRFQGKSREKRDDMVEPFLAQLPEGLQADIMNLVLLAPSEVHDASRLDNYEFEHPSPSLL